jgi:putative phosphoribosyl transferase
VIAAPVGSPDAVDILRSWADEVVCLETPAFYFYAAVPQGYHRFRKTSDDEVIALLDEASDGFPDVGASDSDASPTLHDEQGRVIDGPVSVAGHLTIPERPTAKRRAID